MAAIKMCLRHWCLRPTAQVPCSEIHPHAQRPKLKHGRDPETSPFLGEVRLLRKTTFTQECPSALLNLPSSILHLTFFLPNPPSSTDLHIPEETQPLLSPSSFFLTDVPQYTSISYTSTFVSASPPHRTQLT